MKSTVVGDDLTGLADLTVMIIPVLVNQAQKLQHLSVVVVVK